MLRTAVYNDLDQLKRLWQSCFDESERFTGWFFGERFLPGYCAICELDGGIVSAMHALPFTVSVRGRLIRCAEIAGVATDSSYRRRNLMRDTFRYELRHLRSLGIPLVTYKPVDIGIYRSLQHYPVADKKYLSLPCGSSAPDMPDGYSASFADPFDAIGELYTLYSRFAARYSGIAVRSYADFFFKLRDYTADPGTDGACCVTVSHNGTLSGYCILSGSDNRLDTVEAVADDDESFTAMLAFLGRSQAHDEIRLILPPDSTLDGEVRPVCVAGVADVGALLSLSGLTGFTVAVTDSVLPENSGVYDICGARSDSVPQLRLDTGRLAQFVFGYKSLAALAEVFDGNAVNELDKLLPCQCCYIIDEY